MYGIKRFIVQDGKSTSGESANKERAEETWGGSDGDGVYVIPSARCIGEGFIYDWSNGFEVGAGRDFWDNSAVSCKNIYLRNDNIGKNMRAVFYDRGGGLVAARFYA